MAISRSALMNIDPVNTIVSFDYEQTATEFLSKTTYRKAKDAYVDEDGVEHPATPARGSLKETLVKVFGTDDIVCRTHRQGRLGVALSYKATIDRAIARNGADPIEWTPKEKNGFVPVEGYENLLWESKSGKGIALQCYDYTTTERKYFIKGVEVPAETFKDFFPTYEKRYVKINGTFVLDENGEKISMSHITPKTFYVERMSNLHICKQVI